MDRPNLRSIEDIESDINLKNEFDWHGKCRVESAKRELELTKYILYLEEMIEEEREELYSG